MTSKTASRWTLVWMVEREAIGHAAAPVVPDEIESRVSKLFHDRDEFVRHGSLRIRVMILGGGRRAAAAIAAKIDTDHRMVACEPRRQMAPHQAGSGKPMHHEERGSFSVAPDENGVVAGVDLGCLKVMSAGGAGLDATADDSEVGPSAPRIVQRSTCVVAVISLSSFKDVDQYRPSPGQSFAGRAGLVTEGAGRAPKTCFAWMNGSRTPYVPQIGMLSSIAAAKPCIVAKIATAAVTKLVW